MSIEVYANNTGVIELHGLRSVVEDRTLDQALVRVTIQDADGTPLDGQTWPLDMLSFEEDSPPQGNYRAEISADLTFVPNTRYTAVVEAEAGPGVFGHWEITFMPRVRASMGDIFVSNSNQFDLEKLTDNITGELITDATVGLTVTDRNGNAIPLPEGMTWPLAMPPSPEDSPAAGNYRVVLSHAVELTPATQYFAVISIVADDVVGEWEVRFVAKRRTI